MAYINIYLSTYVNSYETSFIFFTAQLGNKGRHYSTWMRKLSSEMKSPVHIHAETLWERETVPEARFSVEQLKFQDVYAGTNL